MPWVETNPDVTLVADGAPPPEPKEGPGALATLGAAFRQDNEVVSTYRRLQDEHFPPDPTYNPLPDIQGTKYFQFHADNFAGVTSRAETDAVKHRIDEEEADRATLDAAGLGGTLAQLAAGTLNPSTWMVPVGGELALAGRMGTSMLRSALRTGASFGAGAALSEAALQATHETRTFGESAMNVATATLLGGLLGPATLARMSPSERAAAEATLTADRIAMAEHAGDKATADGLRSSLQPAGAAVSDVRDVTPVRTILGTALDRFDPMSRIFGSKSASARQALADLAETPLRMEQNLRGEATTSTGGPAISRLVLNAQKQGHVAVHDEFKRLWVEHRYGEPTTAPLLRDKFESFTGRDKNYLTFEQFDQEVAKAMRRGDTHDIPQVQQAAQFMRKHYDEWKDRAIGTGFFPEDVKPKGADSYLNRLWNKQAIGARRNEFVDKVTEYYRGDQTTKAQAQERIRAYHGALQVADDTARKISSQLESRTAALEKVETRAEEVRRFNEFAFRRSERLSQPIDAMRARIRSIEGQIEPQLARLSQLAERIRAEREQFPEIRDADSLIFKMIGAAQKLKQSRELIDATEAAREYVAALDETIGGFKGGVRAASAQAQALRRELGADALIELERTRTDLRKEIAPFIRDLNRTRKSLRVEVSRKGPVARGGAVFETRIRSRGNTLADQASGRRAELADLEDRLAREVANRDAMRTKIEEEIGNWQGRSATEAKAAIKAREKYITESKAAGRSPGEKGRLTSADDAIDRTVKRILESDRARPDIELRARAEETTDRILSSADGRLSYEANAGAPAQGFKAGEPPRGPLAERRFAIPDAMVEDFLEPSALFSHRSYLRTIVPDVLLTERYGDTAMTEAFRKINDDYTALRAGVKSEKTLKRLETERQRVIADMAAVRDRIRGVYGFSSETPMRNAARVANAVKNYNTLSLMGMSAISSLPDAAGAVFRHGFTRAFDDAWRPFFNYLVTAGNDKTWVEAARQFRAMGIATESFSSGRMHAMADITDLYRPNSPVERALSWGADRFQLVNLLGPWTDWAKINASMVAGSEILRATKAAAEGTISKRHLALLGESNIDQAMAARIWREFQATGEVKKGVHLPNTADWSDAAARQAFEGAVAREADIAVLTPGQEKPLWLSSPILSLLGQFKSFTISATQRILLANLQRSDAQTLQGLIFSMGLGMLSYKLNTTASGRKTSDRPQDWVKEAIDRGGVMGFLGEGNALASKMTRGGIDVYRLIGADKPLSRYASRSVLDHLIGPTAGKIEAMTKVTGATASGDWNASDTAALRRLQAFQNLFWARRAFDEVEGAFNRGAGIPQR